MQLSIGNTRLAPGRQHLTVLTGFVPGAVEESCSSVWCYDVQLCCTTRGQGKVRVSLMASMHAASPLPVHEHRMGKNHSELRLRELASLAGVEAVNRRKHDTFGSDRTFQASLKAQVHVPFHWSIARPSPASTCLYNMNCDLSLSSSDSGDCSLRVHAQPWLMLRRRRNCFNGLQVSSQQSAPTWSLGRSSAAAITQDSKISEMRTFQLRRPDINNC